LPGREIDAGLEGSMDAGVSKCSTARKHLAHRHFRQFSISDDGRRHALQIVRGASAEI
jgi:hypothetical protein